MKKFKYELGQKVKLEISGEEGKVIGRYETINADDRYMIRYKTSDGSLTESWWDEDAIVPANAE